jgi:hypothetical protein
LERFINQLQLWRSESLVGTTAATAGADATNGATG